MYKKYQKLYVIKNGECKNKKIEGKQSTKAEDCKNEEDCKNKEKEEKLKKLSMKANTKTKEENQKR